ncbi:hypothetical protein HY993_01455 [Candidatus Micrarchaeota archaeon]|nr:hypothetical protein [Candidatus Micrarchaeota archaeon]
MKTFFGRKRGQLLSADAVIALLIAFAAIGVLANALDSTSRAATGFSQYNPSAFAAESLVNGESVDLSGKCFKYSNGTSTCASFFCPVGSPNTFVSKRLAACLTSGYCLLEVRSCA